MENQLRGASFEAHERRDRFANPRQRRNSRLSAQHGRFRFEPRHIRNTRAVLHRADAELFDLDGRCHDQFVSRARIEYLLRLPGDSKSASVREFHRREVARVHERDNLRRGRCVDSLPRAAGPRGFREPDSFQQRRIFVRRRGSGLRRLLHQLRRWIRTVGFDQPLRHRLRGRRLLHFHPNHRTAAGREAASGEQEDGKCSNAGNERRHGRAP